MKSGDTPPGRVPRLTTARFLSLGAGSIPGYAASLQSFIRCTSVRCMLGARPSHPARALCLAAFLHFERSVQMFFVRAQRPDQSIVFRAMHGASSGILASLTLGQRHASCRRSQQERPSSAVDAAKCFLVMRCSAQRIAQHMWRCAECVALHAHVPACCALRITFRAAQH